MYLFSAVPRKALLTERDFPELSPLSANWQMMREEALKLNDEGYIRSALHNNDIGFNSFFKRGWKRFYLKWYDQPLASAQALCPRTVALLNGLPNVKGAMFALLGPNSYLTPHRDLFAGSLRYHLGLVTANSDACFISVDGERYAWRDGEAVLFDETYIHFVENNTDVTRIILLCDIERPLRVRLMQAVNRWVSRCVVAASSTQNVENEPVGARIGYQLVTATELEAARRAAQAPPAPPPLPPDSRDGRLPLSFAQQRLWFLAHMEGVSETYHIPFGMRLRGQLDVDALQAALNRIVARHEALRTTFELDGALPVQRIAPEAEARFALRYTDLCGLPDTEAEAELKRRAVAVH